MCSLEFGLILTVSSDCPPIFFCFINFSEKDEFRQKKWRDMEVGDIVRLNNNDIIPCDMLLIKTSDENGLCHISSANLDGENNLKQKKVPKGFLEVHIYISFHIFGSWQPSSFEDNKFCCTNSCRFWLTRFVFTLV